MKARTLTFAAIGAALALAGGIGAWINQLARTYYTDADTIRVPAAEAPVRSVLWQPAQRVLDAEASTDQYEPRVSADGSVMVFVRGRAGENADLYQRHRLAVGWSDAEAIASINTERDELGPELSRDGKSLYFYSDRPGGLGGYDIWVSRAGADGWGEPVNLGPSVNSEFSEYGPALTPDGKRLYFASNRPRPGEPVPERSAWPATVREQRTRHDYDLFLADLGGSSPAAAVLELNSPFDEGAPAISPAGDFLYFASDRPGGLGGFDIFRSRILRGRLQPPENLGAAVNSAMNDLDPAPSMDGFRLFFSSDRVISGAGGDSTPSREPVRYSLWVTGSREVFTEAEPLHAASLIASLWNAAWPWLLSVLLALLLGALLYRVLRDEAMRRRFHRLSLMAKCVVVSLIIHGAILTLLAAWRVGGALGEMMHSGGSKVILGSTGDGGLAAQVRGGFTTADIQTVKFEPQRAALDAPEVKVAPVMLTASPAALTVTPMRVSFPTRDATEASSTPTALNAGDPRSEQVARSPDVQPPRPAIEEPAAQSALDAAPPGSPRAALGSREVKPESVSIRPDAAPVPRTTSRSMPVPESPTLGSAPSLSRPVESAPDRTDAEIASGRIPAAAPAAAQPEAAAGSPAITGSPRATPASQPTGVANRVDLAPGVAPVPAAPATLALEPRVANSAPTLRPERFSPEAETMTAVTAGARLPDAGSGRMQAEASGAVPTLASGPRAAPLAPVGNLGAAVSLLPAPAVGRALAPGVPEAIAPAVAPRESGPNRVASIPEGIITNDRSPRLPEQGARAAQESSPEASAATAGLPSLAAAHPQPGLHAPASTAPAVRLDPPAAILGTISTKPSLTASALSDRSTFAPAAPDSTAHDIPPSTSLGLRLPAAEADAPKPAETFAQRAPEIRAQVLERTGGSKETEQAVGHALEWFKSHQSRDGHWSGRHFDADCGKCSGEAEIDADAAMTGMALLCYLGAGHTQQAAGPYRDLVKNALTWLVSREDASGDLRRGETMYSQTIASVALCEAYAMTRDPWLEGPARSAVTFVARGAAGRRDVRTAASDTSVLGWQIMAIKSAQRAGFTVPTGAFDDARRWLDRVAAPGSPGRYAYRPGDAPSAAATAEAMFVLQLLGHSREEPRMRGSATFVLDTPPAWRREAPTHYWYYATLALFQQQGDSWQDWNAALARELLAHQHQEPGLAGSWDPHDEWSQLGGRVYQTAVCTLSLEVYYRYRLAEDGPPR